MEKQMSFWNSAVSSILGTKYPIIQAPMFGVTTPEMVAAAEAAGALGSLSLGDLSAEKCIALIRETKQLTGKAFAVNIFLNTLPQQNLLLKQRYERTKQFLQNLTRQYNLDVIFPEYEQIELTDYRDQVDALIAEDCKIVSFTFGILDALSIEKFKQNGTILIGTCTSVEEAIALERAGIDLICVQGYEAGGHRGSFLGENVPDIGALSLLSQIYDSVQVPLIYAGGIYNAKTLRATKMLGAEAFQVGSLLLGSLESALREFEKERLRVSKEGDIVLTKSFSGRYARGLRNTFTMALDGTDYILPYPYQNRITTPLRIVAKEQRNTEFLNLWAGQSHTTYSGKSTKDIILELVGCVENDYLHSSMHFS